MSTETLHPVLAHYPGAALEISDDGVVVASNGRLDTLVGRSLVGVRLAEVLDASSQEKWRRLVAGTEEKAASTWELVVTTPHSLELCTFLAVRPSTGASSGFWLLEHAAHPKLDAIYGELSEVNAELVQTQRELSTERRRLARALEKAERAIRTRDDVLAIVSHDLRSPLNTIVMAATLLKRPLDEEKRASQIAMIRRAATGMDRLIGDLLDASAIQAGRLALEPAPVSLAPLLEEARRRFEAEAEEKNLRLNVSAPEDLVVNADPFRIQQVLGNLISNAVKFTPEGGEIEVRAEAREDEARIVVRDSGPGIPEEQLPNIFDRFFHADRSKRGGAGLGLAISKGIVEAHGGRIGVESEEGEGSVFWFSVPEAPRSGPSPPSS